MVYTIYHDIEQKSAGVLLFLTFSTSCALYTAAIYDANIYPQLTAEVGDAHTLTKLLIIVSMPGGRMNTNAGSTWYLGLRTLRGDESEASRNHSGYLLQAFVK